MMGEETWRDMKVILMRTLLLNAPVDAKIEDLLQ
jgi:hypothetical protein